MFVVSLLLFFSTSLLNVKPSPVFADVYIGSSGPYRFLVDTGTQTTLVDRNLAAKLSLRPEFRVQLLTVNSTRMVPGMKLHNVKVGERPLPDVEVLFDDVEEARRLDPSVEGILGLNALASFDFTLVPQTGQMEDTAERPIGEAVPFFEVEGRMAIKARMGDENLTLILDSGSNNIVLFHIPQAMAKVRPVSTTIATIEGSRAVVPTCWSADMSLSDHMRIETLPAAIVQANGSQVDGLLPVSVFKSVHVDQSRHEVILVR